MKNWNFKLLVLAMVFTSLFACKKNDNNSGQNANVSMRLTDAPGNYDAVYIDIRQIGVTISGQSEVFITPNRTGVYNILSFRNGLDTLLVNTTLPAGSIQQVRLILGDNNSVVVNGISYPMSTPSAQESGLKLNLNTTLNAGASYTFWIDFDAGKSIVQTGNGSYKLKPVIRAYSATTNGMISGYVQPVLAFSTVYAINGSDTVSAIPSAIDGHFTISGLASGTYQVMVVPAVVSYFSFTTSVNVQYGVISDVGTITLHD